MRQSFILLSVAIFCINGLSQTVYDAEAVRPFQGEPPIDNKQNIVKETAQPSTSQAASTTQNLSTENIASESSDSGPAFAGQPTIISAADFNQQDETETVVVSGRIYQCRNGNTSVFVDEDSKSKFSDCSLIREQQVVEIAKETVETPAEDIEYCTGMIQFRGNTYVFNDKEPCPIPAGFFQMLTPIEAQPAHYLSDPVTP